MRRAGWAVVLGAWVAAASGGCDQLASRTNPADRPTVARSLAPAIPADGLVVESVLVEQPAGDPFLDRGIWATARPVGGGETRVLLAENGLRVGLITGTGPQRLQDLFASESDTVNSKRMSFASRKEAVVPTAGPVDPCAFAVVADLAGQPQRVNLKQARCGVLVRPVAADGRVRLGCEPQIQHGTRRELIRPNEDGTRFTKSEEVPLERFPDLGFEVTLGPDDYLVVGGAADQPGTLGSVLFSAEANGRPRQRVLVIRARSGDRGANDLPPIAGPGRRR